MRKDEHRVPEELARVVRAETLGAMVERQDAADAQAARVAALIETLQKFALAGNAGGAIAAMSLIGTSIAKTSPQITPSYPWQYFAALLLFILGLAVSWWTIAAKLRRVRREELFWEATVEEGAREDVGSRWRRALHWIGTEINGVICASVLLAAGTVLGLFSLAAFARW